MRTFQLIFVLFLLTFISCSKEDWQTVDITGGYTNTPDLSGGFLTVALPSGETMLVPKKYIVGGADNLVGEIDTSKSVLNVSSVLINPLTNAFDITFTISYFNKSGESVNYKGTAQNYDNGTGLSWQQLTGGTGKFEGITGWLNTSVAANPTGVLTIKVIEGQATYKF